MRKAIMTASVENQDLAPEAAASGVHCWNVGDDIVYADALAADLFGFSEEVGAKGLPIESYMVRIHRDDLQRVAASIECAMMTGKPYHEEYRIVRADGSEIAVIAMGHWFRDQAGEPKQYSGMLFPKTIPETTTASVEQLCLIAYDMAQADGQLEAADRIIDVLECLAEPSTARCANVH